MEDQDAGVGGIAGQLAEQEWADAWAVAWEGDDVVCVKPLEDDELLDVGDLVDFMAERGYRLGYAPGSRAADPQYQFKRR